MVKVKVLYKSPSGKPFVRRVRISGTKHIQDKTTGRMKGRKSTKNGDTINRNRVTKKFYLVKKSKTARGHIRSARKEFNPGQFV